MENASEGVSVPSVASEFLGACLPDRRLGARLIRIAEACCSAPEKGFPQVAGSDSQLEGIYRFLRNRRVSYGAVMEAHVERTAERVQAVGTAVVVHDTTEMQFRGEVRREGLGFLRGKDQGFLVHCALAVAADGSKRPLGVMGLKPWVRSGPARSESMPPHRSGSEYAKQTDKESDRWAELVEQSAKRCGDAKLVHVMDREADAYPLLNRMRKQGHAFVVRMARNRVVSAEGSDEWERLSAVVSRAEDLLEVEVPLSRRKGSNVPRARRAFAPRDSRIARLRFSAARVSIKRPHYLSDVPASLPINVVRVHEVGAPEGTDPVEWVLATSEPIESREDVEAIVNFYRTRWLIEEFFKSLKTGCSFEHRQLESYHALLNALALFVPIAWQLLLLRNLARTKPNEPASAVLSQNQVQVLVACSKKRLPSSPTVREALYAVAALGGHLRNNGDPGWQVLGRGIEKLLVLEVGWNASRKRDQ